MKKLLVILVLGLLWCDPGYAEDINFNLKLSCTTIETKRVVGEKTYPMDTASNKKPEIYYQKKIKKNNKIESWWLSRDGSSLLMIAFDFYMQKLSNSKPTSADRLSALEKIEFPRQIILEEEFKQPGQTMFYDTVEGMGYEHYYLSKDNSELIFIFTVSDPEFLKEQNIVVQSIHEKKSCK